MRTFQKIAQLRSYLRTARTEGQSIGFVPTMGALHEGHLTLFRRARAECDRVVVSIFVNPTQFSPNEDLNAYPRDLISDQKLASQENVDALFCPEVEEMFPEGFQTGVELPELSQKLEGASRPGHFRGVATVVTKLLNIVTPDRAYFGMKDYQQLLVIERMIRDLNMQVEVIGVPTVREADGLAMSSRNAYLSQDDRKTASSLYTVLKHAESLALTGTVTPKTIESEMFSLISSLPNATVDYIALVDPETLLPVEAFEDRPILVALAVRIGKTRLIDNMLIATEGVSTHRPRSVRG